MDLHERNVELEVDLGGSNGERATGVVEGGFDGGGVSVLFAFQEEDAAEAGKDLRVGGTVFMEGLFVLKNMILAEGTLIMECWTYTLN